MNYDFQGLRRDSRLVIPEMPTLASIQSHHDAQVGRDCHVPKAMPSGSARTDALGMPTVMDVTCSEAVTGVVNANRVMNMLDGTGEPSTSRRIARPRRDFIASP
ncbi:hypothetical protein SAMN05443551_2052 [Marivita hallyeonensis]|uniref:Uncharacterized protein n=1 Tax=Marivita hallyeonensis TaxID=996342 RepID=A0A1M5SAX8_9RHOB|nr:hypothetical protein SAMN05443551_2052 [Marivita hallyeonensis]